MLFKLHFRAFQSRFGRVLGEFWERLGRILEGFGEKTHLKSNQKRQECQERQELCHEGQITKWWALVPVSQLSNIMHTYLVRAYAHVHTHASTRMCACVST